MERAATLRTTDQQQFGCRHAPDHRPTIWVHYTPSCKSESYIYEDGQKIARNMLSWLQYQ